MDTRTESYVEAVEHLPDGAMMVMQGVSWDEYERLLEDLGDHSGVRVTYDEGRLEIMSPSDEHEECKEFILFVARILAEERGIPLETRGAATRKRQNLRRGTEPDTSFYVANAHRIIGRRKIDLDDSDPPPDVVVEIDITKDSRHKFAIYASFDVPEIWRYDGTRFEMYGLTGTTYSESATSRSFPGLTCSMLLEFLELSKVKGQTEALKAFRQRIRATHL